MSRQNVELLNSMEVNERLDYAEKLVFGIDGIDPDLSAGMHVIKTEAHNGNPKAEFLMYKVNISRGKTVAAINWLKSAYDKGYGEALVMAYYEYCRGKFRKYSEKQILKSLKEAAKMNVPSANYFMGILSGNEGKDEEAEKYFALAEEQGFSEDYLDFVNYKAECRKMKMLDFRGFFQRQWLPELFVNNKDLYIDAISKGKLDDLIRCTWNNMIDAFGRNPADYPLEFTADSYISKNEEVGYCVIEMPELPNSAGYNLAVYAMAVFSVGNGMKPRFFLGETDDIGKRFGRERLIFVAEPVWENDSYMHHNYGTLSKMPFGSVKKEDEPEMFVRKVLSICGVKTNLKKYSKIEKKEVTGMYKCTELLTKKLEEHGVGYEFDHFEEPGSHDWVRVNVKGKNLHSIIIEAFFPENSVCALNAFSIGKVNDSEKIVPMLKKINELNISFMYIKFYMDEENVICASMDGELVAEDTDYAVRCYNNLVDFAGMIDDAYPEIMKVLWN